MSTYALSSVAAPTTVSKFVPKVAQSDRGDSDDIDPRKAQLSTMDGPSNFADASTPIVSNRPIYTLQQHAAMAPLQLPPAHFGTREESFTTSRPSYSSHHSLHEPPPTARFSSTEEPPLDLPPSWWSTTTLPNTKPTKSSPVDSNQNPSRRRPRPPSSLSSSSWTDRNDVEMGYHHHRHLAVVKSSSTNLWATVWPFLQQILRSFFGSEAGHHHTPDPKGETVPISFSSHVGDTERASPSQGSPSLPMERHLQPALHSYQPTNIKGIPNYGQTCFLNSVIQALASLEPFVAFVDRAVEIQRREQQLLQQQGSLNPDQGFDFDHSHRKTNNWSRTTTFSSWIPTWGSSTFSPSALTWGSKSVQQPPPPSLALSLLNLLHDVNGQSSCEKTPDPRSVLLHVGQHSAQFSAKKDHLLGREQQDAQEFLQALVRALVEEAGLEEAPSAVPSTFVQTIKSVMNDEDDHSLQGGTTAGNPPCRDEHWLAEYDQEHDMDDDVLTVVSSIRQQLETSNISLRKSESANGIYPGEDNVVPPDAKSAFPGNGHDAVTSSQQLTNGGKRAHGAGGGERRNSEQNVRPSGHIEDDDEYDYDIHVPRVNSENALQQLQAPLELVDRPLDRRSEEEAYVVDECLSDLSNKEQQLSAAMRIMMTTTSSICPAPFCGWLGSALQCRSCQHVRPIQNSPFYDLPVVPSAVSQHVHYGVAGRHPGDPPSKHTHERGPPCTIEACLEDFTSVERVHDVECLSCTWKAEIMNLQEEVAMLEAAMSSLAAKAQRSKSSSDELMDRVQGLKVDLLASRSRLLKLQQSSPDDESTLKALVRPSTAADDINFATSAAVSGLKLKRSDAYKCLLLTRRPSILSIHVQRRYYDASQNRMAKTMQQVVFPEFLNLAPFCVYGGVARSSQPWAGTASSKSKNYGSGLVSREKHSSMIYKLMAVIEHQGGAFSGHYVCYRRDPLTDDWLLISDHVIKSVSWDVVRRCQAYLLFYEAI